MSLTPTWPPPWQQSINKGENHDKTDILTAAESVVHQFSKQAVLNHRVCFSEPVISLRLSDVESDLLNGKTSYV